MTYENNSGLGVYNRYGPVDVGGGQGKLNVDGMTEELVYDITGAFFNEVPDGLVPFVLPAGAVIKSVYINVEEVFVVGGTSPTLLIGTDGSEVTNGVVVSEAILEAVGPANLTSTLAGTWDAEAPLAAATTVGIAKGGTSPTITDAGRARITIIVDKTVRTVSPA